MTIDKNSVDAFEKRFDVSMKFVNGYINSVPFNSGKDDEMAGEILTQLLQDCYDPANRIEDLKADTLLQSTAQKKAMQPR